MAHASCMYQLSTYPFGCVDKGASLVCLLLSFCRVRAVSLIVSDLFDLLFKKCASFSCEVYCCLHLVIQVFTTYYWFSMLHLLIFLAL